MVCSLEKEGAFNPQKSRIKIFQDRAKGLEIVSLCQLCDPAPCVDVCPVGALQKDAKAGNIIADKRTCIGESCLHCTAECPYGAITWDVERQSLVCCDLCGGDPECAKFCRFRALLFERCDPEEVRQQKSDLEKLLQPVLEAGRVRGG